MGYHRRPAQAARRLPSSSPQRAPDERGLLRPPARFAHRELQIQGWDVKPVAAPAHRFPPTRRGRAEVARRWLIGALVDAPDPLYERPRKCPPEPVADPSLDG